MKWFNKLIIKFKSNDKQKNIMIVIFLLLLVVVIGLLITAINVKTKSKENKDILNYVIPITKEGTVFDFNVIVNSNNEAKKGDYYFKVANYREEDVLEKNIKYQIEIEKSRNLEIKLYKDNNFLKKLNDLEKVEGEFSSNKKEVDSYMMKIKLDENLEKKDSIIRIRVKS